MKNIIYFGFCLFLMHCSPPKQDVDMVLKNATVYTVDSLFTKAEAVAIKDGKIVAVGTTAHLEQAYNPTKSVDIDGKFVYPGFIDAHTHFVRYSLILNQVDLTGAKSWEEVVDRLIQFSKTHPDGWLIGMGWDQSEWPQNKFPENSRLNELFPDRPVVLTRIDSHALIANQKALEAGGVTKNTRIDGGTVELKNGELTGILLDNAMQLVQNKQPEPSRKVQVDALMKAQENGFAAGLTSVHNLSISYPSVELIDSLQQAGKLKMKVYALLMATEDNLKWLFDKGKIKTPYLQVRGFKAYADGALGSRGACLLEPYSDQPNWSGFLRTTPQKLDSVATRILQHKMQLATHAIGDSANRMVLKTYAKLLKGKNDERWRIEHAQVINKNDFHYFGDYNIVPSVQPTHAISDLDMAPKRLGEERLKFAYANKTLLEQNNWLPLGTDFPFVDISPLHTFFEAVFRQNANGEPKDGFQMKDALTREEALRGITIWAARAGFEENERGSLIPGKDADIVVMDTDLMTASKSDILHSKVLMTFSNGERVYALE